MVPKPIMSSPAAAGPTAKSPVVSYFGYQFESPTPEVREERKAENLVVLSFSDCAGIAIFKPQPGTSFTQTMQQGPPEARRAVEDLLGTGAARSDYEFRRKILNMTPSDLSLLVSPSQMAGNSTLLALKGIDAQRFMHGLYSFESQSMHGFQEGDVRRDRDVVIEAFDNHDHCLRLIVASKPGKACFGQPELNRIIFSLRPVPPSE